MTVYKNHHRSAGKVLKPANLKKLRETKMSTEKRPRKSKKKVDASKYEEMTSEQVYHKLIDGSWKIEFQSPVEFRGNKDKESWRTYFHHVLDEDKKYPYEIMNII